VRLASCGGTGLIEPFPASLEQLSNEGTLLLLLFWRKLRHMATFFFFTGYIARCKHGLAFTSCPLSPRCSFHLIADGHSIHVGW